MIKERYVNFEVAKLLRDKGFDEECFDYYVEDNPDKVKHSSLCESNSNWKTIYCSAPTQAMTCDWLIENYKIHIEVSFVSEKGYVGKICDISDFNKAIYMVETKYYSHIEQVYNEAIKYVLTNFI